MFTEGNNVSTTFQDHDSSRLLYLEGVTVLIIYCGLVLNLSCGRRGIMTLRNMSTRGEERDSFT